MHMHLAAYYWYNVFSTLTNVFLNFCHFLHFNVLFNFNVLTALHAMQTRSSDENSVRLSVRPSVKRVIGTR